jgi:choline dehydrogenase-like flavoprotein
MGCPDASTARGPQKGLIATHKNSRWPSGPGKVYCGGLSEEGKWKSREELERGDIQVLFTPGSYQEGKKYALEEVPGMSCGARQQRPYSAGHVRLRSPRPEDDPLVQPNYLADARDHEVIVRALKLARRLMATRAMAPYFDHETLPGPKVASDDEWLDFARRRGSTVREHARRHPHGGGKGRRPDR